MYVVMERGEMDLAVFFRASKTPPEILQRLINPCWMQMLYAVKALHEQGNASSHKIIFLQNYFTLKYFILFYFTT